MINKRRHFLKSTLAAGIGPFISGGIAGAQIIGANNRLRLAVAGLNGRGKSHIDGFLGQKGVEIAYLIDPDKKVLARRMADLRKKVEGKGLPFTTKGISDVREALGDKSLDALSIATPNHWHSLMTIWAAQAGKHVYVEKPMSHDVSEGRICVEAQQKYGVVIQHGTQRRSDAGIAGLSEAIRAGKFGRLKISYGYCCKPRSGIGFEKTSVPPGDLDWNLWRGPARIDHYHANYAHYNWHWFWKTGNGDMNNQGTHQLDVAAWALDEDQTNPSRVMSLGGRFQWNDQGETPNTMMGMAEYPNGQWALFNVRNVNYKGYERQVENEYYFEDGGRIIRNKYYAPGSDKGEPVKVPKGDVTPGGNWGSFIAACREGKPEMANGNVLEAHYGCVLGHLMNNSYRLGEKVPFNAKAGRFGDNAAAAEHFGKLHNIMSEGVGVPENEAEYVVGPWLAFDPKTEKHIGEGAAAANALLKDPNRKGFEIPVSGKV
ncbi:Gfo/Idh/MocA family oxidoreductase [Akkermansiaceae bacterium]|nr:Gfo/Idh/MocA family oxidoreductase [Akkermansiaceae bacterium]MDB4393349.1 Gfo/Idh/MocA family oxidoreductase [bacterium]MDA7934046.1 Gfo/Idh/MocA family oxidoreductase [Akkermansiaceae bacterium]MDA9830980.1 Gfo/Idh/MocA family oxidoreductase [Akkermansiaceae bacterium]MDB4383884.1 Gfo/Idh/MocA family oxidoreductase [Akkermansiaceae bacterium]